MACGRLPLIAPWRRLRPKVAGKEGCPFCLGSESMTPPAVGVAMGRGIEARILWKDYPGSWTARIIPNLYPVAKPGEGEIRGYHEVIVESPRHVEHPHEDLESFEAGLRLALSRLEGLWELDWILFVGWFKNSGRLAGASISHVHSQIIALNIEPPCIPKKPMPPEDLAIAVDNGVTLYPHPTPEANYHLVITPNNPAERPWLEDVRVIKGLARLLAESTRFYVECLSMDSYNAWLWTPPKGRGVGWWVEVAPSRRLGGLERGYNLYVVETPPEEVAREARRCLKR